MPNRKKLPNRNKLQSLRKDLNLKKPINQMRFRNNQKRYKLPSRNKLINQMNKKLLLQTSFPQKYSTSKSSPKLTNLLTLKVYQLSKTILHKSRTLKIHQLLTYWFKMMKIRRLTKKLKSKLIMKLRTIKCLKRASNWNQMSPRKASNRKPMSNELKLIVFLV
mgnify:CR=1 FL=1